MTEIVTLTGKKYAVYLYRNMLRSARRLPEPRKRDDAIRSVREGFRLNSGVEDDVKREKLLREAESKLGFLKIVTPRRRIGGAGQTTAVYRDGKVMDGVEARQRDKARHSNWDGKNLDPEAVSYHKRNLARAGFKDHSQVYGPGGF